ncbi:hypothetical protein GGU10DRAFT_406573 [Lentinula aff. detonsa]|uniref:DUF6532 domain-containing protein n=1 Tax=Lentinula aff. detonsa TaxID=2804958 RepID=A0AA38NI49_9AGAR|nr:hypothetical protein GGU10DRAFT_406573 [Lentinula aff. detonsa]
MSAPNTRVTRGKKVNIDPSLLPRTREERKSEKNEKITKAQVAKEAFDAEQSQKAAKAKQKIALVEDKRALEQAERQSLRPDLIYQGHLPPPSASTVIRTGSSARTPKPGNQIELQVMPELVPSSYECPSLDNFDPINIPDISTTGGTTPGVISESNYVSNMVLDNSDFEDTHCNNSDPSLSINDGAESDGYQLAGDDSDSDSFDYAAALQELKKARQESKQRQAKEKKKMTALDAKKVQRTAIRDGVTSMRVEAPVASIDVIQPGFNIKKRVSNSNETNIAKRAKPELGGLRMDYRKLTTRKPKTFLAQATTSSEGQANLSEPDYSTIPGEFDNEEQPEAVAAARALKQKNNSEGKKPHVGEMAGVSLVPADVSAIDTKERHGNIQRAPAKRQNVTKANLPLTTAAALRKWDTEFMPTIVDFVGAQEFQFGMSNNVEFKFFIKSTWVMVYPLAKEQKDDPAIATLVHNQIRTYRSEIGKKAMSVVAQRLNAIKNNVEERVAWVEAQLSNDCWAYSSPGHTRATSAGAMRGPMILETFASHCELARTFKAKSTSGFPAGALALSAAAVLRALRAHTPGYDSIKHARQLEDIERKKEGKSRVSRNTKDSFGDEPWSEFVSFYFRLIFKANEAKWMSIFDETEPFINVRKLEKRQGELVVGEGLEPECIDFFMQRRFVLTMLGIVWIRSPSQSPMGFVVF